ncbi:beta-N-acetylhexosaminidase [Sphingobacterium olei]|uniref:beta-N-acetylhexosaminidase n=1 Tax=Sphingobacterium olei TaxID=2571155 RepID=A0A4U0P032_9SPHI|nr:family 20 glycosylhydrolase [Sphingobacterium olei]TJZ60380.1 beta-N-acetylhexosaminidase [Sphingobacterium olei]
MLKFISYVWVWVGICFSAYAQSVPSLIPLPQKVQWENVTIDLTNGLQLYANDTVKLANEIRLLTEICEEWGISLGSPTEKANKVTSVVLQLDAAEKFWRAEGAYKLTVHGQKIHLIAGNAVGIYHGLHTLRQLYSGKQSVYTCEIEDWPSYAWRGYLVDVGRNYQSMEILKEQIDVMARYKMNIFHFHFTEDIAWRLVSKKYPELTQSTNMLRWAGHYYTEADFKELIKYCLDRHITLIPEIDMPGHSGAFRRVFQVDMQSVEGTRLVKDLVREFVATYPELPYLHIGGDEVKITNQHFLPEMTAFIDSLGKQTIGWDPGGNLSPHTIRQLWMGGPKPITPDLENRFVDSKHLYINHMDPLETVVTLFHRQIGEQTTGNANLLGGILCAWPDRAVSHERDVFLQNAVYPGLLAFAERSWRGGGQPGWVCNIVNRDKPEYADFRAFEDRLLVHKTRYFSALPFPYVRQADIKWDFIGPYDNEGDLARSFDPESVTETTLEPHFSAEGGTVVLRHWWSDVLKGVIDNPQPNTTWYARTQIWSDREEDRPFWIGFDNLSRSYASDSPIYGHWDNRKSLVWVNGLPVNPPDWQQAGKEGQLELPMIDEGYSFREPTLIRMKKGWNNVLIKLPVGSFKGKDWENPVKWMFTFIPLTK